jgi:uncharacterized membrane protein YbjE (DUF340 family)
MIKNRNIALCIFFSIITCGIYAIYWLVMLNSEMNRLTPEDSFQTGSGLVILFSIITCGIYGIYWAFKMGQKMNILKNDNSNHVLFLVLELIGLGIVNMGLMQAEINRHALG